MNTAKMQAQAERFGAQAADKIGSAIDKAGTKVDAAIDYVSDKSQEVTQKVQRVSQESWDGVRRKTTDCVRTAPFTTFVVTMGVGILVGWLLRKVR